MPVSSQIPIKVSTANGSTSVFPYDFLILDTSHLTVTLNGVVSVLSVGHSVSGAGNPSGGNVTILTGNPANGVVVVRQRTMPYSRTTDFQYNGNFQSTEVNADQDAPVMMIQQLAETLSRALVLPTSLAGQSNVLPAPSALKPIVWNATATGLQNGDTTLTGDMLLRGDLVAADAAKGAALVAYTDPVAPAFLKVTSDIINGERVSVLRGITKALHAGIRASTDATDHAAGINALMTAMGTTKYGDLFFPRGTYNSGSLTAQTGLRMTGENGSKIKAIASLGAAVPLLINATISGSVDTYYDSDIIINDLLFECAIAADRSAELLSFIKTQRLRLNNVRIVGPRYMGLAIAGSRGVKLIDLEISGTGKVAVTAEGGAAIWLGNAGDSSKCFDVWMHRPYIHDTEWSAIYANATRLDITDPHIVNVKESAIFASNLTAGNMRIRGGMIMAVRKKNISASAIELGAFNVMVQGVHMEDIDQACVAITDSQNVQLLGNTMLDFGKDTPSNASAVTILTTVAAPNQPKNIKVANNRIIDRQGTVTGYGAVSVVNTGAAVENVHVHDNDCTGWVQRGPTMIQKAATKWGTGSFHANNAGTPDAAPVQGSFQPSAGTGSKTVTGIGFRPRRLEFRVTQQGSATDATLSLGTVNSAGVAQCIQIEARVSATAGSRSGEAGSAKAWHMVDASGAIIADATFTSYDDDGFTYNVGTASAQPRVHYTAYP